MVFFPADHLIQKNSIFNKSINYNKKYLDKENIFIFGIKPDQPSSQYGYFLMKKNFKGVNKVSMFIDKPSLK